MEIMTAQTTQMKNNVVILLHLVYFYYLLHTDIEPKCPSSQFKCFSNNECIDSNLVCDEKWDCEQGEDEINCSKFEVCIS